MSIDQQTELDRSARSGNFLERLANRVGINSNVSTVFGDPVEREGITVIPVAKVGWGFGGGSGSGGSAVQNQVGEGTGAGGGAMVYPVGYIELKDGKAIFHRIYDPGAVLRLVVGAGIVTLLVVRSIRKLVRG